MDLICGGSVEIDHIISAVRMRLGQFDEPAEVFPAITARNSDTPENRALSLTTAEKALVLLKNDGLLPRESLPQRIAVIGPNADTIAALVGQLQWRSPAPGHTARGNPAALSRRRGHPCARVGPGRPGAHPGARRRLV